MKIKKTIIAVLALLLAGFSSVNVWAEVAKMSMTVSPPNQKILLTPGETYRGVIGISSSNDSEKETKYSISIGPFSETGEEGKKGDYGTVDYTTMSSYNQIVNWISLSEESGVVYPNKTNNVEYTIRVPKDAPAGGQYASIIVRSENNNESTGEGVAVQNVFQILSIIYAEVAGETREVGDVVENNVPAISFGSPLVASSLVRNSGNVHTDAEYVLEVYPLFSDNEIYTNAEDPMTSLILPDSERFNTLSWDEAPTVGIFRVRQTVAIFGQKSVVEKIVLICPLWLLVIICIILVSMVVWVVTRNKNRKKSEKRA